MSVSLSMDFHMKQWGGQHHQLQSDTSEPNYELQKSSYASANAAKIPKLLFDSSSSSFYPHHQSSSLSAASGYDATTTATLPLFVPEEVKEENGGKEAQGQRRTAHPYTTQCRIPRNHGNCCCMGSCFSWAQWQELELQALIFRYLMAGATVPPELLQPIKKSLILFHSSPHYCPASHYPPTAALLYSGYRGRSVMDPEPDRCRRTDGKKWRCSRDVVVGHKYCERHMHRGRNRSRKHVEISSNAASSGGIFKSSCPISTGSAASISGVACGLGSHRSPSGCSPSSSVDVFHLNKSSSSEAKPRNPADSSRPDVSLKLSTGNGDEPSRNTSHDGHPQMSTWASMGGPLAEAILRPSSITADSSPTVMHHLACGSTSVANFVIT